MQDNQDTKNNEPTMQQILQNIRTAMKEDSSINETLELTTEMNQEDFKDTFNLDSSFEVKNENSIKEQEDFTSSQNNEISQNKEILEVSNKIEEKLDLETEQSKTSEENIKIEKKLTSKETEIKEVIKEETEMESSKETENTSTKANLLSEQSASETSKSLKDFIKTVSKPTSDGLSLRSGVTVEDLLIEMMKPYLSQWLDKNLPTIVKQIIEKEINKLIPKDE